VNGASLLFRWPGRADCAPLLLSAHQDVVPVEPGTEDDWTHPPFAGTIAAGYVWGRGAIDDKASLLGILEAVEQLLGDGFVPACPVYLAFGHDEEVGGRDGAQAIAARLRARGVTPAFVLDEGGALTQGTLAGLALPLATIGVAEKGYLSVRLSTGSQGGHSSMPPRSTAIGALAGAVARLERDRPAAELGPVQRELLRRIAPHLPFARRLILTNLWLTAPLVESLFAASPATDATLRTTTAPTWFRAGIKDNILPQQAEAVVNFRIRPGDSIAGVIAHVRAVVDDESIRIEPFDAFGSEPTAPASWEGSAFGLIETAVRQASPEVELVVAPYVTHGATDARHYAVLTSNLYRFAPYKLMPDELAAFHGTNERIAIAEHARAVRFYLALLRGFGADPR
jgi:carboxypeptidase PM20D1